MSACPPITAIVIFRNERRHLERCLAALQWCDELIAVDMESSDGSLEIAQSMAHRVLRVARQPIAEPTRVVAARLAKHNWVLLVDPDEEIPAELAAQMREGLSAHPDAGAFSLPMWFYFKGRRLTNTVWGTLTFKQRLIHRERCELLPWCNRITRLRDGFRDVRLPHDGQNHMRHYWSDSYTDLMRRHLTRYCHTEAKAVAATERGFTLHWGLTHPLTELRRSMRDFDGWRTFPRGWLLSAIYFSYVLLSCWLVPYYRRKGTAAVAKNAVPEPLPTLTDVMGPLQPTPILRSAA